MERDLVLVEVLFDLGAVARLHLPRRLRRHQLRLRLASARDRYAVLALGRVGARPPCLVGRLGRGGRGGRHVHRRRLGHEHVGDANLGAGGLRCMSIEGRLTVDELREVLDVVDRLRAALLDVRKGRGRSPE